MGLEQSCSAGTGKPLFLYIYIYISSRVELYPPLVGGWPKIKYLINNHRSHITLISKYLCSVAGHNHVIIPSLHWKLVALEIAASTLLSIER